MKRIGYLYEKICDIENIRLAIDNVAAGRKNLKQIKRLLKNKEQYAESLRNRLLNQTLQLHSTYKFKVIQKNGKEREITAPNIYPDQVVHWATLQVLIPIFSKGMYFHCIGNVEGRGWIKGYDYVKKTQNKHIKYCMKLDIKKFYPSIDKTILKSIFRTKIKDKKTLWLLDLIVDSTQDSGIPIGFYTSQWFANLYLEELDHFIKEKLHIKYYVRYVDDMVMFDTNKRKLHKARIAIDNYLKISRHVSLKENWQVWKIYSRPLDFLGFKFYNKQVKLRNAIRIGILRTVAIVKKKGYCTIQRARSIASSLGRLKYISDGRDFYLKYIKPIISKRQITNIISKYDRIKNQHRKELFFYDY